MFIKINYLVFKLVNYSEIHYIINKIKVSNKKPKTEIQSWYFGDSLLRSSK